MNERMNRLFETLGKAGALEEFSNIAEEWVRATAVEMTGAADDNYLHALRGQMRICIELADGARAALAADESKAKDESRSEILSLLGQG